VDIREGFATERRVRYAGRASRRNSPMRVMRRKIQIMVSVDELEAIENFRFRHRIPTRPIAVRELLRLGLTSGKTIAPEGRKKSSKFRVV
jgi:hypothetical protein